MKKWELRFSINLLILVMAFSIILHMQQNEIEVLKNKENKIQAELKELDKKIYKEEQDLKKLEKTYKNIK